MAVKVVLALGDIDLAMYLCGVRTGALYMLQRYSRDLREHQNHGDLSRCDLLRQHGGLLFNCLQEPVRTSNSFQVYCLALRKVSI